jgi:hypothetical protein
MNVTEKNRALLFSMTGGNVMLDRRVEEKI